MEIPSDYRGLIAGEIVEVKVGFSSKPCFKTSTEISGDPTISVSDGIIFMPLVICQSRRVGLAPEYR